MVVAYRLGKLTWTIIKRLIRTPYVVLFNIAAQSEIAPELLQDDCTGPKLAEAIVARLDDPQLRSRQIAAQNEALDIMGRGEPDPSEKAAAIVARSAREAWSSNAREPAKHACGGPQKDKP